MPNVAPVTSMTILSGLREREVLDLDRPIDADDHIGAIARRDDAQRDHGRRRAWGVGIGAEPRVSRTAAIGRPAAPGVALAGRAGVALRGASATRAVVTSVMPRIICASLSWCHRGSASPDD